MNITAAKEFIGKYLEVISSENPSVIGLKGKVIDETQQLLIIENKSKIKKLIKKQHIFKIDGTIIKGFDIMSRSEERIKKWQKNKK
jgi:ribonuclease P protein subunit POP4